MILGTASDVPTNQSPETTSDNTNKDLPMTEESTPTTTMTTTARTNVPDEKASILSEFTKHQLQSKLVFQCKP